MTRAETFPFRRRGGLRSGHLPALLLALVLLLMTGIPTTGAGGVRDINRRMERCHQRSERIHHAGGRNREDQHRRGHGLSER